MSLIQAPQGESITVVRVAADEKTRKHLQDLGIVSGAQLTPLSFSDGSMIVRVRTHAKLLFCRAVRSC